MLMDLTEIPFVLFTTEIKTSFTYGSVYGFIIEPREKLPYDICTFAKKRLGFSACELGMVTPISIFCTFQIFP